MTWQVDPERETGLDIAEAENDHINDRDLQIYISTLIGRLNIDSAEREQLCLLVRRSINDRNYRDLVLHYSDYLNCGGDCLLGNYCKKE